MCVSTEESNAPPRDVGGTHLVRLVACGTLYSLSEICWIQQNRLHRNYGHEHLPTVNIWCMPEIRVFFFFFNLLTFEINITAKEKENYNFLHPDYKGRKGIILFFVFVGSFRQQWKVLALTVQMTINLCKTKFRTLLERKVGISEVLWIFHRFSFFFVGFWSPLLNPGLLSLP